MKYVGNLKNGITNGYGAMTIKDGRTFKGQWENGKIQEYIQITFPTDHGTDMIYIKGPFEEGTIKGKVIVEWRNGDKYNGEWENDKITGFGKCNFGKESPYVSYEGYWKEGKAFGKGILEWKDWEKYEGEWENGNRNGFGKNTFGKESLCVSYEGCWKADKKHGKGKLVFRSGGIQEGDFENDKYNSHKNDCGIM